MKKLVLGMLVASSSLAVVAAEREPSNNWVGGISYINMSDDTDGQGLSLGGIVGSLGYRIESGDNFYLIPEFRIGTGISDDTLSLGFAEVHVELDRFLSFSVRGQYEYDNGVYMFAAPAYVNVESSSSVLWNGQSRSSTYDSGEFGIGGGVGYNFSNSTSAEVMYEQFDSTDFLSLGFKVDF